MAYNYSEFEDIDDSPDEIYHYLTGKKTFKMESENDMKPNEYITNCKNYFNYRIPSIIQDYEDIDFPPNHTSLEGKLDYTKYGFDINDIEWVSYKEIWGDNSTLFDQGITIEDIKIGKIKDSYIISVLSSLGEFHRVIAQLFKTTEIIDKRPIEVALKIEGQWTIIPLDDKFPAIKQDDKYVPVFGDAQNGALWGVFLEKAWAKVNGSYGNIENGYAKEVFQVFTPFPTILVDVLKENPQNLWNNLVKSNEIDCIMTCSVSTKLKDETTKLVGLVPNFTFSLIDAVEKNVDGNVYKLLKIRNPFGEGEWIGKFSDDSDEWTPELKDAFNFTQAKNDGIFWMAFDDFLRYFETVSICNRIAPLFLNSVEINVENANYFNVLKFEIEDEPTIISFSVEQQNPRFNKNLEASQRMIENLILTKIDGDNLLLINSINNETLTTTCDKGCYLLLFNLDFNSGDSYPPHNYRLAISADKKIKYNLLEPDKNLDLLKFIMISDIESSEKYKNRIKNNNFVVLSGNKFNSTAIGFFYMKNQCDQTKYIRPICYMMNYKSLEGALPKCVKLEPGEKWLFVIDRTFYDETFQTGMSYRFYRYQKSYSFEPKFITQLPDIYLDNDGLSEYDPEYVFSL